MESAIPQAGAGLTIIRLTAFGYTTDGGDHPGVGALEGTLSAGAEKVRIEAFTRRRGRGCAESEIGTGYWHMAELRSSRRVLKDGRAGIEDCAGRGRGQRRRAEGR